MAITGKGRVNAVQAGSPNGTLAYRLPSKGDYIKSCHAVQRTGCERQVGLAFSEVVSRCVNPENGPLLEATGLYGSILQRGRHPTPGERQMGRIKSSAPAEEYPMRTEGEAALEEKMETVRGASLSDNLQRKEKGQATNQVKRSLAARVD